MRDPKQLTKDLLAKGFISEETAAEMRKDITLYLEEKVLTNERLINERIAALKQQNKPTRFNLDYIKKLLS